MFNKILVVCTGNICRSPIGEYLLKQKLGDGKTVSSAGIGALVGYPAEPDAAAVAADHGLDLSSHRARQVDEAMLHAHDLVLAMDNSHLRWMTRQYPSSRGRVYLYGHWDKIEVADPYRKPRAAFEQAYSDIERATESWLTRL